MRGGGQVRPGGAAPGRPGSQKQRKRWLIHRALTSDPVDVAGLRQAAVSRGGLLTDEVRQKVWPKLLGVNVFSIPRKPGREVRQNHKDCSQVLLDVRRSAHRFPPGMPEKQRQVLQEQLTNVILHVLRAHPELHYYQGYHDIAVALLLVSGERMVIALLEKLSTHHLRDFMDPTIDSTKHILNYLMPILQHESPRLHDFMQRVEVGTIFALSWLITWFGHVLANFHHVLRLCGFFLASHPLMAVYFAAVGDLNRASSSRTGNTKFIGTATGGDVFKNGETVPKEEPCSVEKDPGREEAGSGSRGRSSASLASPLPNPDCPLSGRRGAVLRLQHAQRPSAPVPPPTGPALRDPDCPGPPALPAPAPHAAGSARASPPAPSRHSCERHSASTQTPSFASDSSSATPAPVNQSTTSCFFLPDAEPWRKPPFGDSQPHGGCCLAVTQTALEWGPDFLLQLF